MKNKYIWLYENLDKYKYNTKEAKELCKEYAALLSSVDPDRYAVSDEIKESFDRFVQFFNNNPYDYKCGFSRFAIETEYMECGFIDSNGEWFPVGYYQSIRPVESAILALNKVKSDREKIINDAPAFMASIEKATERAQTGYSVMGNVKKASYIKGFLFLILGVWCCISSLRFFLLTDVFGIIKNTKSVATFFENAGSAMENYPLLPYNNAMLWLIFAFLYLFVLFIVLKNFRNSLMEIKLAYKKHVTKGVGKDLNRTKEVVDGCFDNEVESTYSDMSIASMKAENCGIKRGRIAHRVMNTVNNIEISHEYVSMAYSTLSALKTWVVYFIVIVSFINAFAFDEERMGSIHESINKSMYDFRISQENSKLRARKLALSVGEFDAPIYTRADENSRIKYYLPVGEEADVIDTVTKNTVDWCKIKYITDTDFIEGWVMKSFLSLTCDNNEGYLYLYPSNLWASHTLEGDSVTYYPQNTYDMNRESSWQYRESDDPHAEKSITYEFDYYIDIDSIRASIGNGRSEYYYYKNSRPKDVTVRFSSGEEVDYTFDDTWDYQMITFNKTVNTKSVTIVINSTYTHCPEEYGEPYGDVCINEVELLQRIK